MRRRTVQLGGLALALVGYWLPWFTHPAAALRLNGYELSEWVTFLPGVNDGSPATSRLTLLLPLACLALLFGLAAARRAPALELPLPTPLPPARPAAVRGSLAAWLPGVDGGWGWALLALGLLCAFIVFPPYPYLLTAYGNPEFQAQLFLASLVVVGLLLILYLPAELKALLQISLAVIGAWPGLWAMQAVRPVASALLGTPWTIGLGWGLMLLGFLGLALAGLAQLFGPRP